MSCNFFREHTLILLYGIFIIVYLGILYDVNIIFNYYILRITFYLSFIRFYISYNILRQFV